MTVQRKAENEEDIVPDEVAIQILEGVPFIYELNGDKTEMMFSFTPMMFGENIGDIDISLTSYTGRVKGVVMVDAKPTIQKYDWKSIDGHIRIRVNSQNFKHDGVYFVKVYPDDLNGLLNLESSKFSIKWMTSSTMNVLIQDLP